LSATARHPNEDASMKAKKGLLRKLLQASLLAIAALGALPAAAQTTHLQSTPIGYNGGATSVSATFGSAVTAGSCIAVGVAWDTSSQAMSVADNVNGNHTQALARNSSYAVTNFRIESWYFKNSSAGTPTVTATFAGSVSNMWIVAHEIGNCHTTAPLDQVTSNDQDTPGTGTDAIVTSDTGPATTTTNGQYIFAFAFDYLFGGDGITAGTGFTLDRNIFDFGSEHSIQNSAGPIQATFTETIAPTRVLSAMVTFKAAAGGGGGGSVRHRVNQQ
jgi:hypothetical protein